VTHTATKLMMVFLANPNRSRYHAMLEWTHIFHKLVCVMAWHSTLIARSMKWVGSCWSGVVTHTATKLMMVFLANPERSRSHAMFAWAHICHKLVCVMAWQTQIYS
jgi:hypothetical protein